NGLVSRVREGGLRHRRRNSGGWRLHGGGRARHLSEAIVSEARTRDGGEGGANLGRRGWLAAALADGARSFPHPLRIFQRRPTHSSTVTGIPGWCSRLQGPLSAA